MDRVEDALHRVGARDDEEPLLLVARALVRNQDRAYAGMVNSLQPRQVEHDAVGVPLEGLLERFGGEFMRGLVELAQELDAAFAAGPVRTDLERTRLADTAELGAVRPQGAENATPPESRAGVAGRDEHLSDGVVTRRG